MEKIKQDILNCRRCPLYKTRINPVIGEGNLRAKILFIGEGPGASEDQTGHPFIGRAGKILDELLDSAGIKREDVYIANILKCRPPQNRNPQKEEIEACTPYLLKQIETIKPEVICTLGNYSTAFIMEKYGLGEKVQGISKIHGKIFDVSKKPEQVPLLCLDNEGDEKEYSDEVRYFGSSNGLKIIPLYHPAVATYNINMKGTLKEDFKLLKSFK
jgi:DNA polymerase